MHVGCHVRPSLLLYLWPSYQKQAIAVSYMFSTHITFCFGELYYTTLYRQFFFFFYLAHVFKLCPFTFAVLLLLQTQSVRLNSECQTCETRRVHFIYNRPLVCLVTLHHAP